MTIPARRHLRLPAILAVAALVPAPRAGAFFEDLGLGSGSPHSSFHYELTRALARLAGYSEQDAELVAVADAAVDNQNGSPGRFIGDTPTAVEVTVTGTDRFAAATATYWHYPRRGAADTGGLPYPGERDTCSYFTTEDACPAGVPELDAVHAWAVRGVGRPAWDVAAGVGGAEPAPVPGASPVALGIYLHALADSYSHETCMEEWGLRTHDVPALSAKESCKTSWHTQEEYGLTARGAPTTVEAARAVWLELRRFRTAGGLADVPFRSDEAVATMVTVWAHHAQAADRQAYANQAYLPGDVNGDREVSAADLFTLVGLLYSDGGPAAADADGDGAVAPADVFYLVAYLFAGGTAPR